MVRSRDEGGGWLSPEAYNALSPEEKRSLASRRKHTAGGVRFDPQRTRKKPRRRGRIPYWKYQLFVVGTAIAAIVGFGWTNEVLSRKPVLTASGGTEVRATFGFCHMGGGTNCVVDGDTIWLAGQNIRIADIDAPETHDYRCAKEKALGDRATQRLRQLVSSGSVTLRSADRDQDSYGRKLRLVLVNGKGVGDTLVSEGLARYYEGGKRPWC